MTGVGNASTFQMIPVIFRADRERAYAGREGSPVSPTIIHREAEREAAAAIGSVPPRAELVQHPR